MPRRKRLRSVIALPRQDSPHKISVESEYIRSSEPERYHPKTLASDLQKTVSTDGIPPSEKGSAAPRARRPVERIGAANFVVLSVAFPPGFSLSCFRGPVVVIFRRPCRLRSRLCQTMERVFTKGTKTHFCSICSSSTPQTRGDTAAEVNRALLQLAQSSPKSSVRVIP